MWAREPCRAALGASGPPEQALQTLHTPGDASEHHRTVTDIDWIQYQPVRQHRRGRGHQQLPHHCQGAAPRLRGQQCDLGRGSCGVRYGRDRDASAPPAARPPGSGSAPASAREATRAAPCPLPQDLKDRPCTSLNDVRCPRGSAPTEPVRGAGGLLLRVGADQWCTKSQASVYTNRPKPHHRP